MSVDKLKGLTRTKYRMYRRRLAVGIIGGDVTLINLFQKLPNSARTELLENYLRQNPAHNGIKRPNGISLFWGKEYRRMGKILKI